MGIFAVFFLHFFTERRRADLRLKLRKSIFLTLKSTFIRSFGGRGGGGDSGATSEQSGGDVLRPNGRTRHAEHGHCALGSLYAARGRYMSINMRR